MRKIAYLLFAALLSVVVKPLFAQDQSEMQKPTLITRSEKMFEVPSIASQIANGTFKPGEDEKDAKEFNPKHWGKNTFVPGKGFPKGDDPLWQKEAPLNKTPGKAMGFNFLAASATATPTDPTGAVGPNHFVNSWNTSFRIWDKAGNPLTAVASLSTILPGTDGDPIVMYDQFADRFLITQFYGVSSSPTGFDVAISKGPNPVTSGWYVYRFTTGSSFPDYPKFSVWSDGYYITANKDQTSPATSQVVFALERDKMIAGNTSAQMIGFPLTGIIVSGFYSPAGFNANGPTLPPVGNAPIVYMQDDSWAGVTTDHLKIWSVNVNWTIPGNSTISSPQVLNVTPFSSVFDGGSFSNLAQPSGSNIDALQATIMYMAQYRRFPTYNSVVFNFVVHLNATDNKSGIRWYELRQTGDGAPWTIYQEGTYSQPGGHSAFSGTMCMDINGNIGMTYTCVSTTLNPSIRFTGRHASDPLGTMTLPEEVVINGTSVDPSSRYGDYAQMTVDPLDGVTFWSVNEYFSSGRKNQASTFMISPPVLTAMFSGTPTTICSGGAVTFTDQSLASPTSWTWTFTGGTPSSSTSQNPGAITYSAAGTYPVSLTVSDGTSSSTETKTGYITVKDVVADFTGTPTPVVVGNTVTFTDNSSCSPTGWEWSFPGGTPSSYTGQTPPAITYSTTGTYDVSLTVTKGAGTDTKTRTGYIVVSPPVFNITNGSITTCSGDFFDSGGSAGSYTSNETFVETFYPTSPGNMIRFTFSAFSTESGYDTLTIYNGNSSSAAVIGKYHGTTSPGTVTASNASGALTFRFHSDASVVGTGWAAAISCYNVNVPPVANFSASTTSPVVGQTVTFSDLSTNIPTSWAWSFSPATVTFTGGTTANSQNPQVQFAAVGAYTVTLTATNAYGSDPEVKTNYINVPNCTISTFPWTEGFEHAGVIPACWSQEQVSSSGLNWVFVAGNGASNPATAHGGSYDACLKDNTAADNKTRLISPALNLAGVSSPTLTFWHTQALSGTTRQDQLEVYYRTSATGTWTLLTSYTTNIAAWTQRTISLPNPSGDYYIAFQGNAKRGYGVCIDDVQVSCTASPVGISIAASSNPVCAGTSVTYTATPANGGTTPAYQWKVNGTVASGATTSTYTYTPEQGDLVTCVLTSNASCVTGNPATSNTVTMTVNPSLPVSVSIAASANAVCAGTSVTITPTPVNGGTPVYQWFKNTEPVGTDVEYSFVPADGDQVYAIMTSSLACKTGNPATSNTVTMTVNPLLPVSVTVAASVNPVCAGTSVTITPSPVNGGTPAYEWFKNAVAVGNDATYTFVPVDGDHVYVIMTSDLACKAGSPATSNTEIMTVNPVLPVSVSITATANPVDAGTPVTFTAIGTNGGASPHYQWKVNAANAGTDNAVFIYSPVNGDAVSCVLSSGESCTSSNPATSNTIDMVVNATIPLTTTVQDLTISDTRCFNAAQTILIAGDGNLFTVQNGGSATMIAGENILYYPGTVVEQGGYMFGYIVPQEGPWCTPQRIVTGTAASNEPAQGAVQPQFRIYPNPTPGTFMFELIASDTPGTCLVEIYDMKGDKMLSKELSGERKHEFSLLNKPAGIYLIRVIASGNSGTTRIIKQ